MLEDEVETTFVHYISWISVGRVMRSFGQRDFLGGMKVVKSLQRRSQAEKHQ